MGSTLNERLAKIGWRGRHCPNARPIDPSGGTLRAGWPRSIELATRGSIATQAVDTLLEALAGDP